MSEGLAVENTDRVLHENADCRIILTAQHALGINVGGSVIVRDPTEWHRMAQSLRATEDQLIAVANFVGAKCGEGLPVNSGDTLAAAIIRKIETLKQSLP